MQTAPVAQLRSQGWEFQGTELRPDNARLDLSVWVERRSGPLRFQWTYRDDVFDASTIERWHERLVRLLEHALQEPDALCETLGSETTRGAMSATQLPKKSFPARSKPKSFGAGDLVSIEHDWLQGKALPVRISARVADLNLAEWARANRAAIEQHLQTAGGLLLRGFQIESAPDFREFARAIASEIIQYSERSSPRTAIIDGVYTSTDHPPDQPIVLHNEQSYTLNWPMRIGFFCALPAARGGRTPIADSRRILARLAPSTIERFERLGVLYVRNYLDGISLSWRTAFQTEDRAEVERYAKSMSMDLEWVNGERLRTRQVRPAVRRHPITGERTWFNHALFFHVTSLPASIAQPLLDSLSESDLPYNTYYGDGSPITDETLAELRAAFAAETVSFAWERGDVLLLDNMLTAHGREPFSGPRQVHAIMTDPYLRVTRAETQVEVSQS